MPWTKEQQLAIDKKNTNIIVSAGAGSGKTAVLTARTGRILNEGTHINELLILTFTKDAAAEMKERIRNLIKKETKLSEELELIDTAYITTFDSFALSVVKRYHYLLNISNEIELTDESTLEIIKKNIMRNVFNKSYTNNKFQKLIKDYCNKSDNQVFESILKISEKISLLPDKDEYINNYISQFYNEENYNKIKLKYLNILKNSVYRINSLLEEFKILIENSYYEKIKQSFDLLFKANIIDEFSALKNIKIPQLPRNSEEEVKDFHKKLKDELSKLTQKLEYGNEEEIINNIMLTKDNSETIIKIIKEFYKELEEYKKENQIYDFQSIALMAIEIVKNNKDARNELKNSFKEIMIDEYQDTNNIQETFISYISNDNIYMVGDIKQSIYRFRNANPYIFKSKYDEFSENKNGFKIDLLNNFRSRKEVLDDINLIFRSIMDDNIGGANYELSHQMYYGNKMYDENKNENVSYNMKIFTYDKSNEYKNEEIEIFKIGKDIKDKINSNYKIFDKDSKSLRNITYKDFSIIVSKSSSFILYKKVLEYLNIPSTIKKDDKLNESAELSIITNLLIMISSITSGNNYQKFKQAYISLARSYIYEFKDEDIFNDFKNNDFKNNKIYKDILEISKNIEEMNLKEIIEKAIDIIDFEIKTIKLPDPSMAQIRMNKLIEIIYSLADKGYDINKVIEHLEKLSTDGLEINYKNNENIENAVNIMTIHGSKGLEYPICYFPALYNLFNIKDLNSLFLYYSEYGINLPYYKEEYGITDTVLDILIKDDYIKEEVSEKIRLFYVALTRAREQIIIFLPNAKKELTDTSNSIIVNDAIRIKYKSISDILYSINTKLQKYQEKIDINELELTKKYLYNNLTDNKIKSISEEIQVEEINIKNEIQELKKFSKTINKNITKEEAKNIKLGLKFHETLEFIDFKNYKEEDIEDQFIKDKINNFFNNELLKNIKDYKVYQEYEFVYEENHGIIDLLLEDDENIYIIDYKLYNIEDESYIKQLNSYKNYIKTISNKNIKIYLYSIINNELKEIKEV